MKGEFWVGLSLVIAELIGIGVFALYYLVNWTIDLLVLVIVAIGLIMYNIVAVIFLARGFK